jgi:cell shape-determining protein MreC
MPYFDEGPPPRNEQLENALELLEIYRVRNQRMKAENEDLKRQLYAVLHEKERARPA